MIFKITKSSLLIFLVCVLSACASIDRGNFGPFKRSLNTKSHGYSILEDPTKTAPTKMIEVFEVRPGDCGSGTGGWSDCKNDRERSELYEVNKSNIPGSEYWYGWSIYFPKDYPNVYPTKVALGQFHQDKSYPAWMFQNYGGGYHLDNQLAPREQYYKLLDDSELRGKWHKIEVHVRWAKDKNGFFRVWVNGENRVDFNGLTTDAQRVYFKYGVYRSFISRYKNIIGADKVPAQIVYFSNVKRGRSRADLAP